eukprot:scaffold46585_cov60-Phaeocystis_antarctica.AAC.4
MNGESERAYQDFVQYVKKKGSEDPTILESPRLQAQLNQLQKTLDASRADDGRPRDNDGAERQRRPTAASTAASTAAAVRAAVARAQARARGTR